MLSTRDKEWAIYLSGYNPVLWPMPDDNRTYWQRSVRQCSGNEAERLAARGRHMLMNHINTIFDQTAIVELREG